jgi:hypothetical protein
MVLADELIQSRRTHPHSERRRLVVLVGQAAGALRPRVRDLEQGVALHPATLVARAIRQSGVTVEGDSVFAVPFDSMVTTCRGSAK